jgi:hypothetical protein
MTEVVYIVVAAKMVIRQGCEPEGTPVQPDYEHHWAMGDRLGRR